MTLDEICENVRQLSTANGWDQADPAARMLHLTSEMGEVADSVMALQSAAPEEVSGARKALGQEIFDVIWNLCALANAAEVDLETAARSKVGANAARTWAADVTRIAT